MNSSTDSDLKTEDTERDTEETGAIVRALRKLLEGDAQEQRETFEYLKNALEEDRPSNRRLFQ